MRRVMLAMLLVFCGLWSVPRAEAQSLSGWNISLEPSHSGAEPDQEFSKPPPPQRHSRPYRMRRYRYRRVRRYRTYRCGTRRKPLGGIELGRSHLWVEPEDGTLSWDLSMFRVWGEGEVRHNFWLGGSLQVGHLSGTRWPLALETGDFWMNERDWLSIDFSLRYRIWYLKVGWTGYREVIWGVPDQTATLLGREFQKEGVKNTLTSLGDNFMLPYASTGLRFGPVTLETGAALRSWDTRSFRVHGKVALSISGLGVTFSGAYQEDGNRLALETNDDADTNDLAQAIWRRQLWDLTMAATADLAALFGWNTRPFLGPIQLTAGVRYRHILENRLTTVNDQLLFHEAPGSNWSFFVGAQVAFGNYGHPH